jgi:hypothetical protein
MCSWKRLKSVRRISSPCVWSFPNWMTTWEVSFSVVNRWPLTYWVAASQGWREGGRGGGKIPGARSAQRGPEISVECSYRLSSLYVCPKSKIRLLAYLIRWSSWSIVKHTKCEINDFSIIFSAETVSWTSFALCFYQLCSDFLQVIRWRFSRWLRLKIDFGMAMHQRESREGQGACVHQFIILSLGLWLALAGLAASTLPLMSKIVWHKTE